MKKLTYPAFITQATAVHEGRYTYGPEPEDWSGATYKVKVHCPVHGEFTQTAWNHVKGAGCRRCTFDARKTPVSTLVDRVRDKFGDTITLHVESYSRMSAKATFSCAAHGEFEKVPTDLLSSDYGCPKCGAISSAELRTETEEGWLKRFRESHGSRYSYGPMLRGPYGAVFNVVCPDHGGFLQQATEHASGASCRKCYFDSKKGVMLPGQVCRTLDENLEIARAAHGNTYDYSEVTIDAGYITYRCTAHGLVRQQLSSHLRGHGCAACACSGTSKPQREIEEFMAQAGIDIVPNYNYRSVGRKELDVYIPDQAAGVEFDGLYWHSAEVKGRLNIARKLAETKSLGLRVIHVFEDEWMHRRPQVERLLLHLAGKAPKVHARKCGLVEIDKAQSNRFHEQHHIQGGYTSSRRSFALNHAGEVVMVLDITDVSSDRRGGSGVELRRMSSSVNVVGGATRLFKFAQRTLGFTQCVTYSDNRMFSGKVYPLMGFVEAGQSRPDYFYFKREVCRRYHKSNFTRTKLSRMPGFDPEESEAENTRRMGWLRIYDAGKTKWVWSLSAE